jgi:5-methyltetrahydropteroyltriglutamate--homocysteine methyltransferase
MSDKPQNDNQQTIQTTTVGSYPVPEWLSAYPTEQGIIDATRVVIDTQRQAGIDLPTDGELYRFDINHPDTNGMIEYFVNPLGGIRTEVGWSDAKAFAEKSEMSFRSKPAGIVDGPISEGALDLVTAYRRTRLVAGSNIKFTVTSPFMLARTLLDNHYGEISELVDAIAGVLAEQIRHIDARCIQIDEANIPGNPEAAPIAAKGINTLLDAVSGEKAVHFCFGNYGGQTIQQGRWDLLIEFLNSLRCDHLVLELAHRPESDLDALKEVDKRIEIGLGVVDIKVNQVETPEEIAKRIERAISILGDDRVKWVHPDCGFWMLKRSIADRKIASLVQGRDLFLGN